MSVGKKIRILLIERGITIKNLAKLLNCGASNISGKLKRDNFSEKEIGEIADALNFDYEIVFTDRETGNKI